MRYTMSIPEVLIDEAKKAAAEEGAARGKPMPVSEWIRSAILLRLVPARLVIADEIEDEVKELPTAHMHRWNDVARWLRLHR